jgi:hypothetical protein
MTQLVGENKALLKSMENDSDFLKTLIGIFLAGCPGKLAAIRAAGVAHDPRVVMQASHGATGLQDRSLTKKLIAMGWMSPVWVGTLSGASTKRDWAASDG